MAAFGRCRHSPVETGKHTFKKWQAKGSSFPRALPEAVDRVFFLRLLAPSPSIFPTTKVLLSELDMGQLVSSLSHRKKEEHSMTPLCENGRVGSE